MSGGPLALRYEVADGIATVTLNRPDQRNALTPVMLEAYPWWPERRFEP